METRKRFGIMLTLEITQFSIVILLSSGYLSVKPVKVNFVTIFKRSLHIFYFVRVDDFVCG